MGTAFVGVFEVDHLRDERAVEDLLDVLLGEGQRDRVIHVLHARPRDEHAADLDLGIKRLAGVIGQVGEFEAIDVPGAQAHDDGRIEHLRELRAGECRDANARRREELRGDERRRRGERNGRMRNGERDLRAKRRNRAGRPLTGHREDAARVVGRIGDARTRRGAKRLPRPERSPSAVGEGIRRASRTPVRGKSPRTA